MKRNILLFTYGFAGESLLYALDKLNIYPTVVTRQPESVRRRNTGDIFRFSNKFQIYETNSPAFSECASWLPSASCCVAFDWTKDFFHGSDAEAYHIHPSILPMYRGYGAVSEQFLRGVCVSGVSAYRDNGRVDAGGIIFTEKVRIEQHEIPADFINKCASHGANFIARLTGGETFAETEQDETRAFYPARTRSGKTIVDFNASAFAVYNFIRAYSHPYGFATFICGGRRFRAVRASVEAWSGIQGEPAEIINVSRTHIEVACGDGSITISEIIDDAGQQIIPTDFEQGGKLN